MFNEANCVDSAYVSVKIFKTNPQVFVPTAFTPDGDGRNDIFRPIAVGITRIEYFRVFNRWGEQVFATTSNGKGWDGKIGGKDQGQCSGDIKLITSFRKEININIQWITHQVPKRALYSHVFEQDLVKC